MSIILDLDAWTSERRQRAAVLVGYAGMRQVCYRRCQHSCYCSTHPADCPDWPAGASLAEVEGSTKPEPAEEPQCSQRVDPEPEPVPPPRRYDLADRLALAWRADPGAVVGWAVIIFAFAYIGWHMLAAIAEGRWPL